MKPHTMILIISYQEIKGNYSEKGIKGIRTGIISYQEIKGNYSNGNLFFCFYGIISYQEIKGNYSRTLLKAH